MFVITSRPSQPSLKPSSGAPSGRPSGSPIGGAIDEVHEAEDLDVIMSESSLLEVHEEETLITTNQPTTDDPTITPSVTPTIHPTIQPTFDRDPVSGLRYGDPIYYPNFAMRRCDSDPVYKPKWTTDDEMFASKLRCCEAYFEYVVQPCLGVGFVEENVVTDAPATEAPTASPIIRPSSVPSFAPSYDSSSAPSLSNGPSASPIGTPTLDPTVQPTDLPTTTPTEVPTLSPSLSPSISPITPTTSPSRSPSKRPTKRPSHFVRAIIQTAPPVYIPKLTSNNSGGSKNEEEGHTLPTPWKQYFDPETGNYYYHNPESGVTQWDYPERPVPPPPLKQEVEVVAEQQEEAAVQQDLELKSEVFQSSGGHGYAWAPTDIPTYSPTYSWPTYSPINQDDTEPPTITSQTQSPTAFVEKSIGLTIPLDSDATVSEGESNTAFGMNPTLTVDGTMGNRFDTLVAIDLGFMTAIPNYESIVLRLYVLENDGLNCGTFQTTLNPWWQQESVTWMNAPGANGEVLGDAIVTEGNDWVELDVTDLFTKMVDESKTLLSIRLHSSGDSSRCVFASTGGAPLQLPNLFIMLNPREVAKEDDADVNSTSTR